MTDTTKKIVGDSLQDLAEQFHAIDKSLAKLAVGLLALKATLAVQMNPSSPVQGLKQIEALEFEIAKLDPTRSVRERTEQSLEILRLVEKHGGAKQARIISHEIVQDAEVFMPIYKGARLKIKRANQHISELTNIVERLKKALLVTTDIEPRTGCEFIKCDLAEVEYRAFEDLPIVIGDAIHNLKCALDHAWYETVTRLIPGKRLGSYQVPGIRLCS